MSTSLSNGTSHSQAARAAVPAIIARTSLEAVYGFDVGTDLQHFTKHGMVHWRSRPSSAANLQHALSTYTSSDDCVCRRITTPCQPPAGCWLPTSSPPQQQPWASWCCVHAQHWLVTAVGCQDGGGGPPLHGSQRVPGWLGRAATHPSWEGC